MTAAQFQSIYGNGNDGRGDAAVSSNDTQKPQIRIPKKREPNRTEAEWMSICERDNNAVHVLYEPFALRLPSGTKYTPDVVVVDALGAICCWEVKGSHIHGSGGRSKLALKEAAAAHPWLRFGFAQKIRDGRGGQWHVANF